MQDQEHYRDSKEFGRIHMTCEPCSHCGARIGNLKRFIDPVDPEKVYLLHLP
jgi:hypothetical protein